MIIDDSCRWGGWNGTKSKDVFYLDHKEIKLWTFIHILQSDDQLIFFFKFDMKNFVRFIEFTDNSIKLLARDGEKYFGIKLCKVLKNLFDLYIITIFSTIPTLTLLN